MLSLFYRALVAAFTAGIVFAAIPACAQDSILPDWEVIRRGKVTVYKPKDLPNGKEVTFEVRSPVNVTGKDLDAISEADSEDGAKSFSGIDAKEKPVRAKDGDYEMISRVHVYSQYTLDKIFVFYWLAHRGTGSARIARMTVSVDKDLAEKYVPQALEALQALTKADLGKPLPTETYVDPAEAYKVRLKRDLYTAPGKGLKKSELLGIYSGVKTTSGVGGPKMMSKPIVVLNDGTFYEDFDVPVEDFDAEAARLHRPDAWGLWRRKDGVIQVKDRSSGVWKKANWYGPIPGAKSDTKLDGNYSYLAGGNSNYGNPPPFTVLSEVTFYPDGRFTSERTSSVTSGIPLSTGYTTAYGASKFEGTYTLNGHTMTLKYSDGRVERRAFAFMDKNAKGDAIYMNGSPYLNGVIQ